MPKGRMQFHLSRRQLLVRGGVALASGLPGVRGIAVLAESPGLPLGLQLYAVRDLLKVDYPGTLKQIAGLGYTEVEAAGFFGHSAGEVNAAMRAARLRLVSAHFSPDDFAIRMDENIALGRALGLEWMVCSFPAFKDPARVKGLGYRERVQAVSLEDFRYTAEKLNAWGKQVQAAGMRLGYHNYTIEFVPRGGVVPYDEMLRLTDAALVHFELDCGWASVGGGDPVSYLRRFPGRFPLLHVKDFKPATGPVTMVEVPPPAELGRGTVDLPGLLAAARAASVKHCFVEQEGFDMPPMESLRVDADYMRRLQKR
jgi:sugar phosphate isomerase/epimerase